jgi:hypothetical protein
MMPRKRHAAVDRFICKNNIGIVQNSEKNCFFKKQNDYGGMNLQKSQESTKEHKSKYQKLKFAMIFVSSCQHKFSNISSTMHCCQMSKAGAGHVDFLIRTKLIGLYNMQAVS